MPVITISRENGSYGDGIAELLCDQLGYRLLDRGLMRRLASEAGVQAEKVMRLSEDQYQSRTLLERFFADSPPRTRDPGMWAYYAAGQTREVVAAESISRLMSAAYEMGNVVVVGRGSQAALSGRPNVLHVRVVAPLELRVRRHQVRAGLDAEEAREQIVEHDRASAEFVKRYFDVDVADPELYDLIVNTATLPLAAAAEVIVIALTALETRSGRSPTESGEHAQRPAPAVVGVGSGIRQGPGDAERNEVC